MKNDILLLILKMNEILFMESHSELLINFNYSAQFLRFSIFSHVGNLF